MANREPFEALRDALINLQSTIERLEGGDYHSIEELCRYFREDLEALQALAASAEPASTPALTNSEIQFILNHLPERPYMQYIRQRLKTLAAQPAPQSDKPKVTDKVRE